MCDCIDSIVDPNVCQHTSKFWTKSNLFRNLNLDTLPRITAKDLLANIKDVAKNNNEKVILHLWHKIPTSESKDFFYADSSDNVLCEYILLMEFEQTLYKLYPNREFESLIVKNINYITDAGCFMEIIFRLDLDALV